MNLEHQTKDLYENCFRIDELPQGFLYAINILHPGVPFKNLRNSYYQMWANFESPEKAFSKKEKIIKKNNLNPEDIAVYAIIASGRCPSP